MFTCADMLREDGYYTARVNGRIAFVFDDGYWEVYSNNMNRLAFGYEDDAMRACAALESFVYDPADPTAYVQGMDKNAMKKSAKVAERLESLGIEYTVTDAINNSWGGYDKTVAQTHLDNYGEIYLDEYGCPIDNYYDTDEIYDSRAGKTASWVAQMTDECGILWMNGDIDEDGIAYTLWAEEENPDIEQEFEYYVSTPDDPYQAAETFVGTEGEALEWAKGKIASALQLIPWVSKYKDEVIKDYLVTLYGNDIMYDVEFTPDGIDHFDGFVPIAWDTHNTNVLLDQIRDGLELIGVYPLGHVDSNLYDAKYYMDFRGWGKSASASDALTYETWFDDKWGDEAGASVYLNGIEIVNVDGAGYSSESALEEDAWGYFDWLCDAVNSTDESARDYGYDNHDDFVSWACSFDAVNDLFRGESVWVNPDAVNMLLSLEKTSQWINPANRFTIATQLKDTALCEVNRISGSKPKFDDDEQWAFPYADFSYKLRAVSGIDAEVEIIAKVHVEEGRGFAESGMARLIWVDDVINMPDIADMVFDIIDNGEGGWDFWAEPNYQDFVLRLDFDIWERIADYVADRIDYEATMDYLGKSAQNYSDQPRTPEEVDSKGVDEVCPLCGSDSYDGEDCSTCGYSGSPEGFDDIALDFEVEEEEEDDSFAEAEDDEPIDDDADDADVDDESDDEDNDEEDESDEDDEEDGDEDAKLAFA